MKRLISDNYVTGDNIYLRELQNFFFEVLGMMSITHYGAIGDGRRDNYGPLQVAIDDANRRGLSFLYVPYGKFIYTGELQNLMDPDTGKQRITFMGNPHAKIINIRTGVEIEIHQFGWQVEADLSNYYTKDEIDYLLLAKQDRLIAGENITIENNVISASSGGGGGTTITPFFSCPFPTSWSGSNTAKTGTNTFGTWSISTDGPINEGSISDAFDGNNTTKVDLITQTAESRLNIVIELPSDITIKPAHIKLNYNAIRYTTDPGVFQGYNPSTSSWETLYTLNTNGGSGQWPVDADITTANYFSKFRLHNIYSSGGYGVGNKVYEIQVTSGYIKEE